MATTKKTYLLLMFSVEAVISNHTARKSTNIQLTITRTNPIPHLHNVRSAVRLFLQIEHGADSTPKTVSM